jgi:hypothetical protein
LQAIGAANCKMPDFYLFKAPSCACGDDAVRIPEQRRTEGLEAKAHWCTGTLRMTDGFGKPRFVRCCLPACYFGFSTAVLGAR